MKQPPWGLGLGREGCGWAVPHPIAVPHSIDHSIDISIAVETSFHLQVGRAKAEARLALLRTAGLDVDSWLAGAVRAGGELPRTPSTEAPTGLDPTEFDDYDSDETFEEAEPKHAARTYPYTCRVIFGYQVKP